MAAMAIGRFAWLMGVRPRMVKRQYVATTPRPITYTPCRFAHSTKNGTSQRALHGLSGRSSSRNQISSDSNSQEMACGRTVTNGVMTRPIKTAGRANARRLTPWRDSIRPWLITMAAGKSPKTKSAPVRPTPVTSQYMSTSDSHSWGVHGRPAQVNEKGSVFGTRPCSAIHWPAVTCQKKSGSCTPLATVMPTRIPASVSVKIQNGVGSRARRAAARSVAFSAEACWGAAAEVVEDIGRESSRCAQAPT